MWFYISILLVSYGANIICAGFICTPFAKHFIQRKRIFIIATAPVALGALITSFFLINEMIRPLVIAVYIGTIFLFMLVVSEFIRKKKNWKYYIYFIILLGATLWSLYMSWVITNGCSFGSCI